MTLVTLAWFNFSIKKTYGNLSNFYFYFFLFLKRDNKMWGGALQASRNRMLEVQI